MRSKKTECPQRYRHTWYVESWKDDAAEQASLAYPHHRGRLECWFQVEQRPYSFLTHRDMRAFLTDLNEALR